MSGTKDGARKAVATNIKRHGDDFYKRIGAKGGRNSKKGGFASYVVGKDGLTGRERAKIAGEKGGRLSRRTGIKNGEGKVWNKDIEDAERILEEESGRD